VITFTTGDLLEADTDALVNQLNCVGVMGRGLALQFEKAWPENFDAYAAACRRGDLQPGRLTPPRCIINFPTKRHWRDPSRMGDIESGLSALVVEIRARGIPSIAISALGAGLGGLAWADVKPRIENALEELGEVSVTVFEPLQSRA
jgi:O-acetyl-ADP-ribose deacetylase (regulator of RNase III)